MLWSFGIKKLLADSYQLVDAERYNDQSQQEVGDSEAGDDSVGHVLKMWLQQQGQ